LLVAYIKVSRQKFKDTDMIISDAANDIYTIGSLHITAITPKLVEMVKKCPFLNHLPDMLLTFKFI